MKIILKNLKQVEYNVEIESDKNTVKDLKDEIEKAHGFDSTQLKLLHNGKVLQNEKTLEEYQIKDENVIIMMNVKVKEKVNNPPPKEESSSSSVPSEPPKQPSQPVEQPRPNQPTYTEQINSLVEMGYEKSQVEAAINASRGNVELAIEFLTNGIRDIPSHEEENHGENLEDENTIKLKKNASILKVLCHKDPNKLITLLNNIKQKQPDLYNLIKDNEQEFKRLLIEPINQEDILTFRNFEQAIRGGRQGIEIRFTKEEADAIKRLKELGNFDQNEVIQAFIACDKNEEMTANFLFEQKFRENEGGNNNSGDNNNNGNQGH